MKNSSNWNFSFSLFSSISSVILRSTVLSSVSSAVLLLLILQKHNLFQNKLSFPGTQLLFRNTTTPRKFSKSTSRVRTAKPSFFFLIFTHTLTLLLPLSPFLILSFSYSLIFTLSLHWRCYSNTTANQHRCKPTPLPVLLLQLQNGACTQRQVLLIFCTQFAYFGPSINTIKPKYSPSVHRCLRFSTHR